MDQWEQSPVGTTLGTVAGQLSSRPITDDTLFMYVSYEIRMCLLVVNVDRAFLWASVPVCKPALRSTFMLRCVSSITISRGRCALACTANAYIVRRVHEMQTFVTDHSVARCVSLSVVHLRPAETAEGIEVPSGVRILVGTRNVVRDGVLDPTL